MQIHLTVPNTNSAILVMHSALHESLGLVKEVTERKYNNTIKYHEWYGKENNYLPTNCIRH